MYTLCAVLHVIFTGIYSLVNIARETTKKQHTQHNAATRGISYGHRAGRQR